MDVIALFDRLRDNGFSIGVDQYLSAHRLIARVAETSDGPLPRQRFKTLLAPLVCRSPGEQTHFQELFDRWESERSEPEPDDGRREDPRRVYQQLDRSQRTGGLLVAGLAVTSLVAALTVFEPRVRGHVPDTITVALEQIISRLLGKTPPPPQNSSDSSRGAQPPRQGGSTVVGGSVPRPPSPVSPPQPPPPILPPPPIPQPPSDTVPGPHSKVWWVAPFVCLLALLVWWSFFRRALGRAARPDGGPAFRLDPGRGVAELIPERSFRGVGRRLRERLLVAHDLLDPVATAEATARSFGRVTERYRGRFGQPEYLCLVDRRSEADELSDAVVIMLRRMAINAVVYTFDRDPRHCRPIRRFDVRRSLNALARAHPGHRLLLFSDATGMVDRRHGHLADWVGPAFRSWPQRILLTPLEAKEWTHREQELASLGFEIVAGTGQGLIDLRLASARRRKGSVPTKPDDEELQPLPSLLVDGDTRWRDPLPPTRAEVEQLESELERYLGPSGFLWLQGCSVFPELHLGLTLLLGIRLSEGRVPVGKLARLDRLLRLPWFRYGHMPDWLRRSLIGGMSGGRRRRVRRVVIDWLAGDAGTSAGGQDGLGFARESLRQAMVRAWARRRPEGSPMRETLFYGFLANDLGQRLAFVVPRKLRAMFEGFKAGPWRRRLFVWIVAALAATKVIKPQWWQGFALPEGTADALLVLTGFSTAASVLVALAHWWWVGLSGTVRLLERPPDPGALARSGRAVDSLLAVSSALLGMAWLLQKSPSGSSVAALYPFALVLMTARHLSLAPPPRARPAGAASPS
jgi:hypothetical protein